MVENEYAGLTEATLPELNSIVVNWNAQMKSQYNYGKKIW